MSHKIQHTIENNVFSPVIAYEIIGIIVIFVSIRALITQNRAERLLYLNVIGFGVSAIIALVINTPFALIVAAAFFICSTISANAIAYTLKRLDEEILLE